MGLMMTGCAPSVKVQPAVDLAALRCPPVRQADRAAFVRPPPVPKPGALTAADVREWVDSLHLHARAAQAAGSRVVQLYDACRKAPQAVG